MIIVETADFRKLKKQNGAFRNAKRFIPVRETVRSGSRNGAFRNAKRPASQGEAGRLASSNERFMKPAGLAR